MIDKIYTVLGSIFLIIAAPFLIFGFVFVFMTKCVLRSTWLWYYKVIPYIKYKVIERDLIAYHNSEVEAENNKKYYE
jgi:hypothetical protein